jgi:hypothetical protein
VHDVVKNELGGGKFPSGTFGASAAWLHYASLRRRSWTASTPVRFALLTYNVLSAIKQLALPPSLETARPKRLRFALFTLAARITSHPDTLVMKIGRCANGLADLLASRLRIAQLSTA